MPLVRAGHSIATFKISKPVLGVEGVRQWLQQRGEMSLRAEPRRKAAIGYLRRRYPATATNRTPPSCDGTPGHTPGFYLNCCPR